jgi:hypothetical protein
MNLIFKVIINKEKSFSLFFFWYVPEYISYSINRLMKFNGKSRSLTVRLTSHTDT